MKRSNAKQTGFSWAEQSPEQKRARKQRAREKRAEALDRVEESARAEWLQTAKELLYQTALRRAKLTSDDLWDAGLEKPREPRAMGPVFLYGVRQKWIKRTGQFVPCRSPTRNVAPVALWESLVYEESYRELKNAGN